MKTYRAYIDGASRGNPGPAGVGIVIEDEKGGFQRGIYQYLGELTNNQAEYGALILLLRELIHGHHYLKKAAKVVIYSDSRLLVKQMKGEFKVKSDNIRKYHRAAVRLVEAANFSVEFHHVPRENNKRADKLANLALDNHNT